MSDTINCARCFIAILGDEPRTVVVLEHHNHGRKLSTTRTYCAGCYDPIHEVIFGFANIIPSDKEMKELEKMRQQVKAAIG